MSYFVFFIKVLNIEIKKIKFGIIQNYNLLKFLNF